MHVLRNYETGGLGSICDWNGLGAPIGVKTQIMAWTLKNRDAMQTRIKLGERTVFRSEPALRFVQRRLCSLFEPMFDDQPDTASAIAYRKGVCATDIVKNVPHADLLISFDIRHFYDNITLEMLAASLVDLGMDKSGAKLAARYCVVRKNGRLSLQQGSPASPVLSNMVGHLLLDVPIRDWLKREYPDVSATYLRYCDNVALFVHGHAPQDFAAAYKNRVKESLAGHGLRTHKWATVADNHPVMHQKFLGIVLNSQARAELDLVDRLRAMLFNWCREGVARAAERFFTQNGFKPTLAAAALLHNKFRQHVRGHVQYVKKLNEKQGLMLEKLYKGALLLDEKLPESVYVKLPSGIFDALKSYRDSDQSLEDFLAQIEAAMATFFCERGDA